MTRTHTQTRTQHLVQLINLSLTTHPQIVIAIDNVPLAPMPAPYPSSSVNTFLHLLPTTPYASILCTTQPLPVNEANTLTPPSILTQDAIESQKLQGYQSQNVNAAPYDLLPHPHEKSPGQADAQRVLLHVPPCTSLPPLSRDACARLVLHPTYESLHDVLDGYLACVVPGVDPLVTSSVVDLVAAALSRSKVAREQAIRSSLGLRVATLVTIAAGADVTSHAGSAVAVGKEVEAR